MSWNDLRCRRAVDGDRDDHADRSRHEPHDEHRQRERVPDGVLADAGGARLVGRDARHLRAVGREEVDADAGRGEHGQELRRNPERQADRDDRRQRRGLAGGQRTDDEDRQGDRPPGLGDHFSHRVDDRRLVRRDPRVGQPGDPEQRDQTDQSGHHRALPDDVLDVHLACQDDHRRHHAHHDLDDDAGAQRNEVAGLVRERWAQPLDHPEHDDHPDPGEEDHRAPLRVRRQLPLLEH